METLQSLTLLSTKISFKPNKLQAKTSFFSSIKHHNRINPNKSLSFSSITTTKAASLPSKSTTFTTKSSNSDHQHWIVVMKKPQEPVNSKQEIIDYYVNTLQRVLGSEKDAQMCIYDVSCDTHFGFCCNIDEAASLKLAGLPGVVSVRPDLDYASKQKDYSVSDALKLPNGSTWLFPPEIRKQWLVRMDKPGVGVVTKAQMVDYYTQILSKVMGNEKDAQMCIYHVSWQTNFGFCCELDEECAEELAGIPGVLSVNPDSNFASENKDYGGEISADSSNSQASQTIPTKTKKLFVTGLSFYTSEKTLREAFEGFGELVEVKIIMDKISKRSKGYGFVEYATEEAAGTALIEMNGKIINGWMIVVDVAKSNPPKYSRGRPRP